MTALGTIAAGLSNGWPEERMQWEWQEGCDELLRIVEQILGLTDDAREAA